MKFIEQEKRGTVLGNEVKARPVPWQSLRAVDAAQKANDTIAVITAMGEVVGKCVTMADGSPIDAAELSTTAITELFKFATGVEAEGLADFT